MFRALGAFCHKHNFLVLAGGFVFIAAAAIYGAGVFSHLDNGGFASKSFESYQAAQLISKNFGSNDQTLLVLFRSKDGSVVEGAAFERAVADTLQVARKDARVQVVTDYYSTHAPALISKNHEATYAVVTVAGDTATAAKTIRQLRPQLTSNQLSVYTGGLAAINDDFNSQIQTDLFKAEIISFAILAILLVIVFRSFIAALLPLILGAFGVLGAFLVVRLLTEVMTVSQYSINVIILLGLGLAIDYSLFILSRFREELRTRPVGQAIEVAMATAGRAVFFSGITVIMSLMGLMIFPINFLRSMGIGGAAAVVVAMLAALTVLPAIMSRLGNRVNALSFGRARTDYRIIKAGGTAQVHVEKRTLWAQIGRLAMRFPLITVAVVVIPMLLIGQTFLVAKLSSPDYRSLPAASQSRVVAQTLNEDFTTSNRDPISVVIASRSSATTATQLATYTQALQQLPGVTRIEPAQVHENVTLLDVSYNSANDEPVARNLVQSIRKLPAPDGWSVKVGGNTAELVDLLDSLGRYIGYAVALVAASQFILLFLMLGSLVIPLQALFVNALSLSATFGILVWIFQQGHLSHLLGFTSVGSIDATQPILIFGIAFGLSMDYSVFLLTRVKEEYDKRGGRHRTAESVAEGLQKTGTIITSAAVLFIVVVSAFATSPLPIIKQIGIGLGLAIFFDAFIIRMLLVPAIMKLFGHYNWWAPRPLKALSRRIGMEEI
jgi:uncharacterized membrane protein YdfJ with MMPL/SSD domain